MGIFSRLNPFRGCMGRGELPPSYGFTQAVEAEVQRRMAAQGGASLGAYAVDPHAPPPPYPGTQVLTPVPSAPPEIVMPPPLARVMGTASSRTTASRRIHTAPSAPVVPAASWTLPVCLVSTGPSAPPATTHTWSPDSTPKDWVHHNERRFGDRSDEFAVLLSSGKVFRVGDVIAFPDLKVGQSTDLPEMAPPDGQIFVPVLVILSHHVKGNLAYEGAWWPVDRDKALGQSGVIRGEKLGSTQGMASPPKTYRLNYR